MLLIITLRIEIFGFYIGVPLFQCARDSSLGATEEGAASKNSAKGSTSSTSRVVYNKVNK